MRKVAYGVFSNKSRGLPIAVFNSKWHAEGWLESRPGWPHRRLFVQRIWFSTDDKHVFTVTKHLGYQSEVKV